MTRKANALIILLLLLTPMLAAQIVSPVLEFDLSDQREATQWRVVSNGGRNGPSGYINGHMVFRES